VANPLEERGKAVVNNQKFKAKHVRLLLILPGVRKSLKDVHGAQLKAIDDFLKECEAKGKHPALVKLYEQPDEFERLASEHLRKTLATVELEEVKRKQDWQQDHLKVVQLVLPLLLPKEEQSSIDDLGLQRPQAISQKLAESG
jgi:hypothetical protein